MSAYRFSWLAASTAVTALSGNAAQAAELPVPCVAGVCGSNIAGFVTSGRANATATGNTLTVRQQSDRAILNWASFNVDADGRVVFEQPGANAIALNRIFQGSPSRILGAIEANGQIYLINQNGFMFGPTARVRTAGLMASSLEMADSTFDNGLLSPDLLRDGKAALESDNRVGVLDRNGNPVLGEDGQPLAVKINIAAGARIETLHPGERVMLASRTVDNAGSIDAPQGQVIVAAGEKVYLQASSDPALRGLLVEVSAGGDAWNRMTGSMSAAQGNVTVVGLAVNQHGRVSATTSVNANGSIRLLARDSVRIDSDVSQNPVLATERGGTLELGAGSRTTVLPELADRTTAIDEQAQAPSSIEMTGRQIFVRGGAQVQAPGGKIALRALNDERTLLAYDPEARVRVEAGAVIDASGSQATASVARNVVRVELRGNELRDAPLQRDGALRGKEVYVDARVGTPLADVSGALAGIGRAIDERTANGGTISVESGGDIAVAPGAIFNVSGGSLEYTAAAVQTTQLLTADGRAVDIGSADPDQQYVGLINPTQQRSFDRWGVTERVQGPLIGRYEPGYVEGRSAGTLQFVGRALALDGLFLGNTVAGVTQRDSALAPAGGRFIIGTQSSTTVIPDFRAPSIDFTYSASPIAIGDGASLPQRPLELSTSFITAGGFTRVELNSNGVVRIPEAMMLALAPGGSLAISAHRVEANGTISTPGGSIRLASVLTSGVDNTTLPRAGVNLGAGTVLDVSGLWNNELSLLTPIVRDAGTIDLAVNARDGELVLGDGARLLADGGASLSASGAITGGKGGGVGIHAGAAGAAFEAGEDLFIAAFGAAGAAGGKLTLDMPRIEIASTPDWLGPQRLDLGEGDTGFVTLGDSLFSQHGFASFDFAATAARSLTPETLVVRSGASIDARPQTRMLDSRAQDHASGADLRTFSEIALVPDYARGPSSIALRVAPRDFSGADGVGLLAVEEGASLRVETRGSVTLSSVGGISMAGSIDARAGDVHFLLPNPAELNEGGYREDLGISFADSARVNVSGIAVLRPSDVGLRRGDVFAGGSIDVLADRGFIAADDGARFEASGTASALDIPGVGPGGSFLRRNIASAGGSLVLRAPESIVFSPAFDAHAGVGDVQVPGGSATIQLTRQRGFNVVQPQFADTFPTGPRTLIVTADRATNSGGANGSAIVDANWVRASGVDRLALEAGDRIELYAGADLSLGRSLSLAAPLIGVSGDSVNLAAPYVSLGTLVDTSVNTPATPIPGTAHLGVRADVLELTGKSTLTGIADATFTAGNEIRLRGFENAGTSIGELRLAGDLTLASPLIYATTATSFSIVASGGAHDQVRFAANGAAVDRTPISVGGQIDVHARRIEQATRLAAPFGRISLNGIDELTLADGSVTTVSAGGTLMPFGRIQLGTQWTYDLGATQLLDPKLPDPSVDLAGSDVRVAANATIDLAGGGDLYAYEWTPGTGGSRDALAPGATPGLYAVLPELRGGFAPYDPQESFGSGLTVGDSVYLSGISGLPAGNYPLLPARYALLPGAFLVSAVPGTADAMPGVASRLADGTPVVAGYRTFGNTTIRDARTNGFAVRPGSYARQLASYEDSYASTFGTQSRPLAPDDAAHLSLTASSSFDLAGRVLSASHGAGAGAAIDVAAPELVVRAHGATDIAGAVNVDASVLMGWNAASLLLGGRRADTGTVSVSSSRVTLGSGAELTGPEILAVARDGIHLESGSALRSSGGSSRPFEDAKPVVLAADATGAAVLGVSATRALTVDRGDTAVEGGAIVADTGAAMSSSGALLIDAPRAVRFDGSLSGAGASWWLGSDDIVFGPGADGDQFRLDGALVTSLGSAARLWLAANHSITFGEALTFGGFDELVIASPLLRAGGDGFDVHLASQALTLLGSQSDASVPQTSASGTLSLAARDVFVGPGALAIDGFGTLAVDAAHEIVGVGRARLAAAGDITLTAANLGAASDADLGIMAAGTLTTARGTPFTDGARAARELGGHVALSGRDVVLGGLQRVVSGSLEVDGTNSVTLTASGVLDVSGTQVTAAGRTIGSAGGDIRVRSGGTLDARAGSAMRVAGAGGADAGTVSITSSGSATIASTLDARVPNAARGGSFSADVGALANFGALNDALEAGGFNERRVIDVGSGDLTLDAGRHIGARDVAISTGGRLVVAGSIDAMSDNERGSVSLFGGAGFTLASGARIQARGDSGLGRGGHVLLATDADLSLESGSAIDVGGTQSPGELRLRAPSTTDGMRLAALDATVSGVDAISLEPVLRYSIAANPTAAQLTQVRTSVTNYTNVAAPALRARFASASAPVVVRPGIDLNAAGNLTLGALDLTTWRFGGEAARLAFSAAGDLTINGNVSDGFRTVGTGVNAYLDLQNERSSSLSFSAGGDLRLNNNVRVRTGTGDLRLAAGRDMIFGTGAAAYTAGVQAEATHLFTRGVTLALPTNGGGVSVEAGRDVLGAPVTQSVGTWQLRQGRDQIAGDGSTNPPGWGTDVQQFAWNLGTLGGGDLSVRAGRDIRSLSAAAADSASVIDGALNSYGGGVLRFDAGGNIDSAYVHATRGDNRLRAGGEFGRSRSTSFGDPLGSVFSLQQADLTLQARRGVALETIFNPTTLAQVQNTPFFRSFFVSYADDSRVRVASATGDVSVSGTPDQRLIPFVGQSVVSTSDPTLSLLPPQVSIEATDGDIRINGPLTLAPADDGQLELFASRDIIGAEGSIVLMSDAEALPTALAPAMIGTIGFDVFHSAASGRHANDGRPVRINAGRDIDGTRFELAKFTEIAAGRDLRNVAFTAQNVRDTDATLIAAGRDLVYDLNAGNSQIQLGGPGRLDIVAGRDVDLGFSQGISTVGRLLNPALESEAGADIAILAGAGVGLDAASFLERIVAPVADYREALVSFVSDTLDTSVAGFEAAAASFSGLAQDLQRAFIVPLFFRELVASGREANAVAGAGFDRGYAVIDALFPGSRDTKSKPYSGDLKLAFSRIYTLADADISLLVPGGLLNVGLANPPPALAGSRKPSELGIVAQRAGSVRIYTRDDVLVNASRIFTLRGGDIAIWSTLGDIDAGRGAKSAISAPPPTILVDPSGRVTLDFAGAVAGSGIRAIVTSEEVKPGDVDLIAPAGIVDAGDAGIGSAGNLNVAAQQVVGLDNIDVGGASTGVPAETSNLGAALSGASSVASSATSAASDAASGPGANQSAAPLADSAFGFLDVFLEGFGSEVCKPDDTECLKRSR